MNFSSATSIPFIEFKGLGIPIHFAHANGYPPLCYSPLFSLLSKNYHIISMFQRPLWRDSDPKGLNDWRPLALDLLAFLNQQNFTSIIAIGHSMGGIASLEAAILDQDRFKALVLIDPVLFTPLQIYLRRLIWSQDLVYRIHPLIKSAHFRKRFFSDLESTFRGFRRKSVFRYMDDDCLKAYIKGITEPIIDGGYKLLYSPEWEMRIYATGIWNTLFIWKNLSQISIPVLIIRGEETDTFLPSAANLFQKKLPSAELVSVKKTTHLVPLEKPDIVYKIIDDFLQERL